MRLFIFFVFLLLSLESPGGISHLFQKCRDIFLGKRYFFYRDLNRIDKFHASFNYGFNISRAMGKREAGSMHDILRQFYLAKLNLYRVAYESGKWKNLTPSIPIEDDILNEAVSRVFLERRKFDPYNEDHQRGLRQFEELLHEVQRHLNFEARDKPSVGLF